jgi:hypothetical protein
MTTMPHEPSPASESPAAHSYRCGSLTYTRKTLVALFGWLLWGDFCFSMMEIVLPNILPLKLKDLVSRPALFGNGIPGSLATGYAGG